MVLVFSGCMVVDELYCFIVCLWVSNLKIGKVFFSLCLTIRCSKHAEAL